MRKKEMVSLGLIILCVICLVGVVNARSLGRVGRSGNPNPDNGAGLTCAQCHSGGAIPTVTLEGPAVVPLGETMTYTLTILGRQGEPQDGAGFNVSVTEGILNNLPGATDTRIESGEITQTETKPFDNDHDEVVFAFQWTAPLTSTTVTMYGAGNSVDGDLGFLGDGVNTDQFVIVVAEQIERFYLPLIFFNP